MRKIGWIYACVGGDRRYGTHLTVWIDDTSGDVEITNDSTTPSGGMDGPGGVDRSREVVSRLSKPDSADLVGELRRLFKSIDFGTIARYGKPTKRFVWRVGDLQANGLSAGLAETAMRGPIVA